MELWIRSQDRENLLKINNRLFIREIADVGYSIENDLCIDDGFISLGIYETRDRALEVLDEIQNKINLIILGHDFGSPMIDLKNPTYIYQMPKE